MEYNCKSYQFWQLSTILFVFSFVASLVCVTSCTSSLEKSDCSDFKYSNRDRINLRSVSPVLLGRGELKGYVHRLVISNYKDECIGTIPFLALSYNYIDTVQKFRPISGIAFYDSSTPFQIAENSGEEENHKEVAKALIVGFSFLLPYDSVEKRQFHNITFSRGGSYVRFPLEGVALEKKTP